MIAPISITNRTQTHTHAYTHTQKERKRERGNNYTLKSLQHEKKQKSFARGSKDQRRH